MSAKNIENCKITNFSGSDHFEYFHKPIFHFFKSGFVKSAKINSLNAYQVFNLSISLIALIVPTFSAVTALRAQIVGSTIFQWTYFHEIHYGDFTKSSSAKISDREDFCQIVHAYYENLKQNIWTELSTVPKSRTLRDF